ncbi:MAG TPA: 2,3-diphosphoglycerate synthetase, partial [Actinomycetota bacterium]
MRVLVLIDGEHYPPVTRTGIDAVRAEGDEVVAALLLGGAEKLRAGVELDVGAPVRSAGGSGAVATLSEAIEELRPDCVVDLSDEPVVGYRERMHLASAALAKGVAYRGADFRFEPPW